MSLRDSLIFAALFPAIIAGISSALAGLKPQTRFISCGYTAHFFGARRSWTFLGLGCAFSFLCAFCGFLFRGETDSNEFGDGGSRIRHHLSDAGHDSSGVAAAARKGD